MMSTKNRRAKSSTARGDIESYTVVLIGAGDVGKTSIITRFLADSFSLASSETIEDTYRRKFLVNGKSVELKMIDTAGRNAFPAMQRIHMSKAPCIVLVYDPKDPTSIESILNSFIDLWHTRKIESAKPDTVALVANKIDHLNEVLLQDCTFDHLPQALKSSVDKLPQWARACTIHACTSAETGVGVSELFETIARRTDRLPHIEPIQQLHAVMETDRPSIGSPCLTQRAKPAARSQSLIKRASLKIINAATNGDVKRRTSGALSRHQKSICFRDRGMVDDNIVKMESNDHPEIVCYIQ